MASGRTVFTLAAMDIAGDLAVQAESEADRQRVTFASTVNRLKSGWVLPAPPPAVQWQKGVREGEEIQPVQEEVEFEWPVKLPNSSGW